MLNCTFPLYSIRQHNRIYEEPPYKLIENGFGVYVLDFIDQDGTYAGRRLELLTAGSGYKVYPLKERFDSIASFINSTRKMFIDADGKILRKGGDDRTYYKCIHKKVLHYEVAYDGNYRLFTADKCFLSRTLGYYVEYIRIGKADILLNVVDSLDNVRHRVLV
ncbi:hypothetical protein VPHD139G2_0036 [Vibrio phage D139 g2]